MCHHGDFEFATWVKENDLDADTIEILHKHGFKSYKALVRVNDEPLTKLFAKTVSAGQYVLLEAGLELSQPPNPPPTAENTTAAPPETP